ncbi:MAG: hydrogenase 3 maturation endopeptidase HyCI [Candidatus Aegiribacteria sp.]|nr:hydrogenase 3 maturation endopeptidase HyCI [Candidatus Aegiribacteria sp.]
MNEQLRMLEDRLSSLLLGRVVFMGIGNILRGDDGIGPELVSRLSEKGLCTVDAGTVPENHIRSVTRFDPDTVIIVDAVHLDREPGAVELLDRNDIKGETGFTTHSLSPVLVMERLEEETGAGIFLLAIQPGSIEFGAPLSPAVAYMLEALTDLLSVTESTS